MPFPPLPCPGTEAFRVSPPKPCCFARPAAVGLFHPSPPVTRPTAVPTVGLGSTKSCPWPPLGTLPDAGC